MPSGSCRSRLHFCAVFSAQGIKNKCDGVAARLGHFPEAETLFKAAFLEWLKLYKSPPTRKYLHKNEEIEREAIESMSNHLSMENLLNTPQLNGARKRGKFAGIILPDFSGKGKASGQ